MSEDYPEIDRGRRYSMPVIRRAQALREAAWTYPQIQTLLQKERGEAPSIKTIERWCLAGTETGAKREEYLRDWARAKRARNRVQRIDRSPQWKLERMRELYARGLSLKAIGQVSAVWFGEELTVTEVKSRLGLRSGEVVHRRTAT